MFHECYLAPACVTRAPEVLQMLQSAPDQLPGGVTAAADMWSFGVILHELLVGSTPWQNTAQPWKLAAEVGTDFIAGPSPIQTHVVVMKYQVVA